MKIAIYVLGATFLSFSLLGCDRTQSDIDVRPELISGKPESTPSLVYTPLDIKTSYNFPIINLELYNVSDESIKFRMEGGELNDLRIEAWRYNRGVVLITPRVKADLQIGGFRGYDRYELLPGSVLKMDIDLFACEVASDGDEELANTIISSDGHQPTDINIRLRYIANNYYRNGSTGMPTALIRVEVER